MREDIDDALDRFTLDLPLSVEAEGDLLPLTRSYPLGIAAQGKKVAGHAPVCSPAPLADLSRPLSRNVLANTLKHIQMCDFSKQHKRYGTTRRNQWVESTSIDC